MDKAAGEGASVKPDAELTVSVKVVVAVVLPEVPVMVTVNAPVVAVLVAVSVSTLLPAVGLGPQAPVTPLGRPDAARVTLPVNPPTSVTVMVSVAVLPWIMARVDAEGASVKPVPGMVRARVAEWTSVPSVPVNKTLYVPTGVLACEVKFTVTVPLALSEDGEKLAWTPEGSPLALSDTLPVRLPT
jgi:hypothetical protein